MQSSALGATVRAAREARGWSRATLAKQAAVSSGTVSSLELYGTAPRWDTVQSIARALDIDLSTLDRASEQEPVT